MKVLLTLVLMLVTFSNSQQAVVNKIEITPIIFNKKELSTEDSISLVLHRYKLDTITIKLIIAQAKHESGNFKNSLTRDHKNIFGRHWHKSDTLSLGNGAYAEGHNNFARYKSIEYATMSQYNYLVKKGYTFKWNTPYEYALELKSKGYYTASLRDYSVCLDKHYRNIVAVFRNDN